MEEGGADVPLKRIEIDTEEHLGLQEKDADSALLSESEHEETYFEGSSAFTLNQDDLSLTIEPIKSGYVGNACILHSLYSHKSNKIFHVSQIF